MLTKNDYRVLDSVYRAQHKHDWFVPHGSAEWSGVRRLKTAGLVHFGGDGACMTCSKMHTGMLYALTDAGEKLLGGVFSPPAVGTALTRDQINVLVQRGRCVVCGARDEYDFDVGNERWGCMACGAEFSLELGERDRVKRAKREKDFEDQVADAEAGEWNV